MSRNDEVASVPTQEEYEQEQRRQNNVNSSAQEAATGSNVTHEVEEPKEKLNMSELMQPLIDDASEMASKIEAELNDRIQELITQAKISATVVMTINQMIADEILETIDTAIIINELIAKGIIKVVEANIIANLIIMIMIRNEANRIIEEAQGILNELREAIRSLTNGESDGDLSEITKGFADRYERTIVNMSDGLSGALSEIIKDMPAGLTILDNLSDALDCFTLFAYITDGLCAIYEGDWDRLHKRIQDIAELGEDYLEAKVWKKIFEDIFKDPPSPPPPLTTPETFQKNWENWGEGWKWAGQKGLDVLSAIGQFFVDLWKNWWWLILIIAAVIIIIIAVALAPESFGASLAALFPAFELLKNAVPTASGGFPATGQSFIAREAGPELVGTIRGRNAVVNSNQIVESVSRGVHDAFQSALSSENSDMPVKIRLYIDGRQLCMT